MSHVVLYYHIVWRTKRSTPAITPDYEKELYAYIVGFCRRRNCHIIRVGGMSDHVHLLVSIRPELSISQFMQVLKAETSKWLSSEKNKFPTFEGWGNGYAAFTYSERDKDTIRQYIIHQKEHHKVTTFKEEYLKLLDEWGIDPTTDFFLKDD